MDSFPIIDLDSHLADASETLWKDYFASGDQHLVPRVVRDSRDVSRLLVADRLYPKPLGDGCGSPLGVGVSDEVATVDARIAYMDTVGVEQAFLTPGFVGFAALTTPDDRARRRLIQASNRLACDLASQTDRLHAVVAVSVDDPEWSIAEVERCRRRTNVHAVIARPTSHRPRPFENAADNPLLNHLVQTGVALFLHTTTGYYQSSPVADLFDDYVMTHALGHPIEQMIALTDILASGIVRSGLRVVVLEAGCAWVPWLLLRLQEHFRHTGGCAPIDVDPVEQARERMLFGVYPNDPGIQFVLDSIGAEVVALMSDYPHWDAMSLDALHELPGRYGGDAARKILFENADRITRPGATTSRSG